MNEQASNAWRCVVCGYIHHGGSPPETCPVCGAASSDFEPFDAGRQKETYTAAPAPQGQSVVIAGGGIAALSAAEAVRKHSTDARITLICKEEHLPYYRLNLTRLLAGEITEDDLLIHKASWYQEHAIETLAASEAQFLSSDAKHVTLASGEKISFQKLILALGADPVIPRLPGSDLSQVFTLRTLADARRVLEAAHPGSRGIVIGGGLLGLEAAGALCSRGVDITLLEGHKYLMPRQLTQTAGRILGEFVGSLGIRLLTQARTKEIAGGGKVSQVILENNQVLSADFVILATGVRACSELAVKAGLPAKGGILVDDYLVSAHPDILAAGDIAEHRGICYGAWAAAQYQGKIAGMNALGLNVEFGGIPRSHTLKVLGLPVVSIGQFEPLSCNSLVLEQEEGGSYRRVVLHQGVIIGAVLLGDTQGSAALAGAIERSTNVSGIVQHTTTVDELVDQL